MKVRPPGYLWSKYECFLMSDCRTFIKLAYKTLSQCDADTDADADADDRVTAIAIIVLKYHFQMPPLYADCADAQADLRLCCLGLP